MLCDADDAEALVSAGFAGLIAGLERFPVEDGRQRSRSLVAPLLETAFWRRLDAIKVTGSNGKGSVAVMTAAILQSAGVACAAVVSPHIRTPAERILVAGRRLDRDSFVSAAAWAAEQVRLHQQTTGVAAGVFEAITAMSLFACEQAGVEALVLEAGIGGRLDPTGIVPGELTGLVSVDLEHTKLLGDSREAIASDKADLAADGTTLVVGDLGGELVAAVRAHVGPRDVVVVESSSAVCGVRDSSAGTKIDLEIDDLRIDDLLVRLAGEHQASNAALATRLAVSWLARHRPSLGIGDVRRAVRQGLASATLPGRFEHADIDPDTWIDVAHTPQAVAALATTVSARLVDRPLVLVAGVSKGRDAGEVLVPLRALPLAKVFATSAGHRGGDPEAVATALRAGRPGLEVTIEPVLASAVEIAREAALAIGATVLVTGSLFLAAEALAHLDGRDPASLGFF